MGISIVSFPGSAWERTALEALPPLYAARGRAWKTARSQAEPGNEGVSAIESQGTPQQTREERMLHSVGRFLQFAGLLIVPVAIAGNVANERLSLKESLE